MENLLPWYYQTFLKTHKYYLYNFNFMIFILITPKKSNLHNRNTKKAQHKRVKGELQSNYGKKCS